MVIVGEVKEVANVGKMVCVDLGGDDCWIIAPKLARVIEDLKQKLDDVQQYIEHKKVYGKSVNFSDAELVTNEIMNELEELLYWKE